MTTTDTVRLLERCRSSVDGAQVACARSAILVDRSSRARAEARWTRLRILERRAPHEVSTVFRIAGTVDDRPVVARWVRGHGLLCPDVLRRRAEVVVAMGDTFGDGDGPRVTASLAEPTAAMLTVLRALSRVTAIEIEGGSLVEALGDG